MMNINFRAQPVPLQSSRASINPGSTEEKTTYFACRNNPHPRTVCHIRGLNDAPVCFVKDLGLVSGNMVMPRIEKVQNTVRTRTSAGNSFSGISTPKLQPLTSKRNNYPQSGPYDIKDLALLSNRTRNTSILERKIYDQNVPLRKYIPEQSQNMPLLETRTLSPTLALRHRPEVMENMNYTLTYLDHEIKILEKLRDILQTDSLTEIKEWLSKASLNEKEFVSNFIRSNITTRDLLDYRQKYEPNENEEAHKNLQATLRGQKKPGTLEEKLLRNISQGSRVSIRTRSERERNNLPTRREKITVPISDSLPLEHSPRKSTIQERRVTPPGLPQTSKQLIYKKSRQPKITEENVSHKK